MDLFILLLVRLLPPSLFLEDGKRRESEQFWTSFLFCFVFGKGDFVQLKKEE